jgi:hypothetical protein
MFQYDDGLLTEMIWAKYVEALEANVRLQAQLKVAEVTVVRLQEILDLQEDANEDNNYLIPQTPDLGVVPDDE